MCDPVAMGVAMGAQAGMQIFGQQAQAKAQRQAAEYNAKVAENNARLAEENVRREQLSNAQAEQQQRTKTASLIGSERAALAASGVDVNSGTSVDIQASTAKTGFEDLLTIRENSLAKQRAFHQQATDFTNKASMDRATGKNAQLQANIQGVTTVLDAGTKYASVGMSQGWFGAE